MPQGRAELHEKFGDGGTTWALLDSKGWTQNKGMMTLPVGVAYKQLSQEERDVAEYLITEWDWDWA